MNLVLASAAVILLGAGSAWGQTTVPAPAAAVEAAPAAEAAATVQIPAGTIVQVEFVEAISSDGSQRGDMFAIRLAEPIIIGDRVVVRAGAMGGGEIIDAEGARGGGREGTLVASGRYIEINGERAGIRGMQVLRAGGNRTNSAMGLSFIPVYGFVGPWIRRGGNIEIPPGTRTTATLAVDVTVPVLTEGE